MDTGQNRFHDNSSEISTPNRDELFYGQVHSKMATNLRIRIMEMDHFSFSIPESNEVILKIYNLVGGFVENMVDEILALGNNQYLWNAEGQPNSVSFYTVGTFSPVPHGTIHCTIRYTYNRYFFLICLSSKF